MNSVTAIEISEDDPNFREVYVDGKHIARVDASTISFLNLEVGMDWSTQQEQSLNAHQEEQHARIMALDLISRRMWGSGELTKRLIERGVERDIANQVTASLIEDDWLDDAAYASALIREWTRKEPAGEHLLREKLMAKQIERSIAEHAVQDHQSDFSPYEGAIACIESRLKREQLPLDDAKQRKIVNAVLRRGFNAEVVHDALRQVLSETS